MRLKLKKKAQTHKALVVVAKAGEQVVGGIKESLADQLEPLPARPSPVQSCRRKKNTIFTTMSTITFGFVCSYMYRFHYFNALLKCLSVFRKGLYK